jgi:hydroxyacyl-ACP dehydratase HTD2-like protein with hotdog domain
MKTIKLSEMSKAKQAKALKQRNWLKTFPTQDMNVYAYGALIFINNGKMDAYLAKVETKVIEF